MVGISAFHMYWNQEIRLGSEICFRNFTLAWLWPSCIRHIWSRNGVKTLGQQVLCHNVPTRSCALGAVRQSDIKVQTARAPARVHVVWPLMSSRTHACADGAGQIIRAEAGLEHRYLMFAHTKKLANMAQREFS